MRISIANQGGAMLRGMEIAALEHAKFDYGKKAKEAMFAAIKANETITKAQEDVKKMKDEISAATNANVKLELESNRQEVLAALGPTVEKMRYYNEAATSNQMRIGEVDAARRMRGTASTFAAEASNVLDTAVAKIRAMVVFPVPRGPLKRYA